MKLRPRPFELIERGIKTVEMRLYDEKRKLISIGDRIVFACTDDETRKVTVEVKALHRFESFEKLYSSMPLEKCGYLPSEIRSASYRDMEEYYSPEMQSNCGVLGIEIELI